MPYRLSVIISEFAVYVGITFTCCRMRAARRASKCGRVCVCRHFGMYAVQKSVCTELDCTREGLESRL